MTEIADLNCAALTECYRRGALSPVEVAGDCLARIERFAALNAFMPIEPETVLDEARASEARWRKGARWERSTAFRPQSRTISG